MSVVTVVGRSRRWPPPPIFWVWLIIGTAVALDLAFEVVPLPFWPLISGAAIATAIWQQRQVYRSPMVGIAGAVLLGVTMATSVALGASDLAFLISVLPAGALILAGTRSRPFSPADT